MMNLIIVDCKPKKAASLVQKVFVCALLFTVLALRFPVQAQSGQSASMQDEFTARTEINALYHNGFWPDLVVRCDLFLKEFSWSASARDVLFKKAVGTYRLGRYAQAVSLLESCGGYADSSYWLGRAQYALGNYRIALDSFYTAAKQYKTAAESVLYTDSLVYASRCFTALGEYGSAIPLLEYLVAQERALPDFLECTVLLFTAYKTLEKNEELVSAYEKLKIAAFPTHIMGTLSYLAAGAYQATGDTNRALELYSALLDADDTQLASSSLQKAYALAEPDAERALQLLETARATFDARPGAFDEFWLRMGISAFNAARYNDVEPYFSRIEHPKTFEFSPLVVLYTAQLYALRDRNPKKALDTLVAAADTSGVYAPYFALDSAKYAMQSGNPDRSLQFCKQYEQISIPELAAVHAYWYSLALFSKHDYEQTVRFLEESWFSGNKLALPTGRFAAETDDISRLYIQSLALTGRLTRAVSAAEELSARTKRAADLLLLAQVYLRAGKSEESWKTAQSLPQLPSVPYTAGMAAVNTGRWEAAEKQLSSVKSGSQAVYARYYAAYSQYRQEKYAAASASFLAFIKANPSHQLTWNAAVNGAMAALQENRADAALQFAQIAYKSAATPESKTDSAVLLAGIYAEAGNFTSAEQTLLPHAQENTQSGSRALFTLADLYSRQKKTTQADHAWMELYSRRPESSLTEEALYRRALTYYDGTLYDKSAEFFTQYRRTFPKGLFADAALYFAADSHNRAGNADFAILYWQDLINSYPKSSYVFSSLMSLMKAYQSKNELTSAIHTAEKLLAQYGEQARNEGLEGELSKMRLELDGMDGKIAALVTEYERAGADSTVRGRTLGLDLAAAYATQEEHIPRAVNLLETVLRKSAANLSSERLTASRAAFQLGSLLRSQGKYEKAAAVLLRAAEYYSPLDPELAARSLYGAADAFDRVGADADARLTVKTMHDTWPDSVWTERAAALLGGIQ